MGADSEEPPAIISALSDACQYEPKPDYTREELAQLASTPEVQQNLTPFAAAPAADQSLYVTMSDGVRLAVSLYFPERRENAPAIYIETWYTRPNEAPGEAIDLYRAAGFVVAIADPRGLGASFGTQTAYLSDEQRRDQRELIAWLAGQPWSNGKVAAVGISVSGMLAEAVLASGAPNLAAGIVRATEWDQYAENLLPGGVPNVRIQGMISGLLAGLRGDACVQDLAACAASEIAPVDGDPELRQLQAALRDHQFNLPPDALQSLLYVDDAIGAGDFDDVSPRGHAAELAQANVPTRVSASWTDGATAQGALARYNALPELPMVLTIGATTHLGGLHTDPFSQEPYRAAQPSAAEQFGADVAFVQHVLAGKEVERGVSYYVLGAGVWKHSRVWPPSGVTEQTLHFSRKGLAPEVGEEGERIYHVDTSTSSGADTNRWASGANGAVFFGDRRFTTGQRLSFDAAPSEDTVAVVGAPELCLVLRSDQPDGIVLAYLEDVAPDGRVTYLTEGVLRLVHRKTASGGCNSARGTERSFKRLDASPVVPGELMEVEIPLLPVAAKIERGHRVRLSLAGADEGTFPQLTETPPTWSVAYGGSDGSTLTLPVQPWVED